jgi:hypothetical protein
MAYIDFLLTRNRKSWCLSNLKLDMSFLSQGMETFSSQGEEMPLNLRIRKEQAYSFRFWSLVRQLEDKGGSVCDNKNKPKQTEKERHQKACEIINSANETRQTRLDEVMMETNEIKSKMTMQEISRCRKCGAIPHASGESCLWRPSADSMKADSDDEKDSNLWCDPDLQFAALHKAKEENTVHQCQFSQCPDRDDHLTTVCPTLHARCVRCILRGHMEVT